MNCWNTDSMMPTKITSAPKANNLPVRSCSDFVDLFQHDARIGFVRQARQNIPCLIHAALHHQPARSFRDQHQQREEQRRRQRRPTAACNASRSRAPTDRHLAVAMYQFTKYTSVMPTTMATC